MRIVFLDDVCIASLSGPTWGMSDSSNQWPDNPQLFTNPHWQCSYNVYCLPVIGMNIIPTQKNNMSCFDSYSFENRMFNWTADVEFFFYNAYQKF